jgi:hypothetical protein
VIAIIFLVVRVKSFADNIGQRGIYGFGFGMWYCPGSFVAR